MITVRNWNKWQSYRKDRGTPPWIKIHRNIMSNPDWATLSDSEKGQMVSIWIVAADKNGEIPSDPRILRKVCQLDEVPNINKFILLGFLESDGCHCDNHLASSWCHSDAPEERRGEERRYRKDDGEEKTERRQTSKSEDQLRESFQKLKPFLSQKFPLLDLEFEEEQCVAKYQNKLPCNDPDVRVMEWCKRAKTPEKQPDGSPPKTKAQQREEANIAAGQEALRMIKAAKEAKANGQGCHSYGSDNTARGSSGRTADIAADYRICGSP